LCCSNSWKWN